MKPEIRAEIRKLQKYVDILSNPKFHKRGWRVKEKYD